MSQPHEYGPEDVLFSIVVLTDGTIISSGQGSSPEHLPTALRYIAESMESGRTPMSVMLPPGTLN